MSNSIVTLYKTALLLTACSALSALTPPPPMAQHDLGNPPIPDSPLLPSLNLTVSAPSWLMTSAMQYRRLVPGTPAPPQQLHS